MRMSRNIKKLIEDYSLKFESRISVSSEDIKELINISKEYAAEINDESEIGLMFACICKTWDAAYMGGYKRGLMDSRNKK